MFWPNRSRIDGAHPVECTSQIVGAAFREGGRGGWPRQTFEAMPDWRGQRTSLGSFTAEGKEAWKRRMRAFFGKGEKQRSGHKGCMQAKRVANFDCVLGLDQALQSTYGFGLAALVPLRPLRPLAAGVRREYLPIAALPQSIQASAGGRVRRSVLLDPSTERPQLETAWGGVRRLLHSMIDCGSVGWMSKNWVYYSAECRGERWMDPPHRRSNNISDALTSSKLQSFRAEALVLLNCPAGPWWGASNHQAWVEAGLEWVDSVSVDDSLFQAAYPYIVHDWCHGDLPGDMFSMDHMQQTLGRLRGHLRARGKGDIVRLNRWFQVWTKTRRGLPDWSANFVVGLAMCIQKGYYNGADDVRLFKREREPAKHLGAAPAAPAPKAAPKAPSRPVKTSNGNVELLRLACQRTLHVATEIMACRSSRAMLCGLCRLILPIESRHGRDVVALKTVVGRQEFNISMSAGDATEYIVETLHMFSDRGVLLDMGVLQGSRVFGGTALGIETSDQVLSSLFTFWLSLVALEISFTRMYSGSMLGIAFGYLHREPAKQDAALAAMKSMWMKLEQFEALAHDGPWLSDYLLGLKWPRNIWARELLLGASETNWTCIPSDLLKEVRDSACIVSSSKPVEDLFNFCRGQVEGVRNGKQSEQQIWHSIVNAPLMSESELNPIGVEECDEVNSGHQVPRNMFRARSAEQTFSLGAGMRERFFTDTDFPSQSIANLLLTPIATGALLGVDSVPKLKRVFLSNLCVEGSVLYRRDDPSLVGIVLQSTQYGALVWLGSAQGVDDYRFFAPMMSGTPWRQVCVTDEASWRAMAVRPRSPEFVRKNFHIDTEQVGDLRGASFQLEPGPASDLLDFATQHAFKHMTLAQLNQLWAYLQVPSERGRPTLVKDVCRGLLSHILGDVSDEDFEEWYSQREARPSAWSSVVEDNPELVKGVVDEKEHSEVEKGIKAAKRKREAPAASAPPRPVNAASPAPASSAASSGDPPPAREGSQRICVPVHERHFSQEQASRMMPVAVGASISPVGGRQWQVKYGQRPTRPRSHSVTYVASGPEALRNHRSALLECLTWVWDIHTRECGGESCPHNLRELVGLQEEVGGAFRDINDGATCGPPVIIVERDGLLTRAREVYV